MLGPQFNKKPERKEIELTLDQVAILKKEMKKLSPNELFRKYPDLQKKKDDGEW